MMMTDKNQKIDDIIKKKKRTKKSKRSDSSINNFNMGILEEEFKSKNKNNFYSRYFFKF